MIRFINSKSEFQEPWTQKSKSNKNFRGIIPEGSEIIEIVIKTHEDQRSSWENGLAKTESEAGASAERARHILHPISNLILFIIQKQNSTHFLGKNISEKEKEKKSEPKGLLTCNAKWTCVFPLYSLLLCFTK